MRLGVAYRAKFAKDFLIDLVGYRRHGHNETDEPAFTQPALHADQARIRRRARCGASASSPKGVIATDDVRRRDEIAAKFEKIQAVAGRRRREAAPRRRSGGRADEARPRPIPHRGARRQLDALNEQLLAWPQAFKAHPRLAKTLERRRDAMGDGGGIDWGHAEALAFASLLLDGINVRLTGQDAERGTFSHRHAVLHDAETGETFTPLAASAAGEGQFEIYNSPLSETAVLGSSTATAPRAPTRSCCGRRSSATS